MESERMGKRWIKVAEESVGYGTLSVETYNCMPYKTLDLQPNQNPIAIVESDERMKTGYMFGGFVGTGTKVLLGRPDNMGWYLKWALGSTTPNGLVNDLYSHTFTMAESIKSYSLEECIGEGIQGRFLTGCLIKRLTLESVMSGPMLMTIENQYNKETLDTQTGIDTMPAIRSFALHDCVVQAPSGTTLKAESVRFNIENTIPDDAHTSGSRYLPDIALEGASINGELELRFESWDQRRRFYGAVVAGPAEPTTPQDETRTVDLSMVWTGPVATTDAYTLNVSLPAVMLTENPISTSERDRLKQRLTFEAIYHASNEITLYSADANYSDL